MTYFDDDWFTDGDFVVARGNPATYKVIQVKRVNALVEARDGKRYNLRMGQGIKKVEKPADWPENSTPELRPGMVFTVKPSSGLFRRSWFRQYDAATLFVVTDADAAKVKFVPLGGHGMPENTRGYTTGPSAVDPIDTRDILK